MTGLGDNFAANTINGNNSYTAPVNPWEGAQNQYAGQNQYLDQMVSDAQGDVTKAYQNSTLPNLLSQFNAGGAYGGTAMQQALSQSNQDLAGQLGRVSTNLRSADYDRQAQLAESALNRNSGLAESHLNRAQSAWA